MQLHYPMLLTWSEGVRVVVSGTHASTLTAIPQLLVQLATSIQVDLAFLSVQFVVTSGKRTVNSGDGSFKRCQVGVTGKQYLLNT